MQAPATGGSFLLCPASRATLRCPAPGGSCAGGTA